MQQYSSLPEQNSQIDTTQTLLTTIQQLRAELWLEGGLNQLQSHLNDCLLSACTTLPQPRSSEADIFQILVNEISHALNTSKVAIALFQPQETTGKIFYVPPSSSRRSQLLQVEALSKKGKKLRLKLDEVIELEDLQHLENQATPGAWQLANDCGGITVWLIVATAQVRADGELCNTAELELRSQFIARAVKYCSVALAKLRHIQSWQQKSQYLGSSNRELERTNQLKNQFLANTSHEIRTPLSSIIGFTHLLLAQGYDPTRERHQEYLNIIQSSSKHLLALINDILDLSKIEANQLDVQWEIVNVPTLCRNVLALVKEKAANKGLKLLLDIEPEITTIVADPLRLKQMLLNLLFNALKFTTTGTVGLQVVAKGSFLHFTVWDTGTGISPIDQAKLFQPYFQIANPTVNRNEGTGLGLAVTRKLAEVHGGCIEVESKVDCGSRFTIVLPLNPVGELTGIMGDVTAASATTPLDIAPSCFLEILLVENDLNNAKLMQIYLEKLGYQVTVAKNAAEMWEALKDINPAVILMDVNLPDDNGLNLVRQLRENSQYQMTPVIAQTAMAMKGDREICLAAGVNDYISKPIDLPLLASLVAKYSKPQ
ncbi:MULTISPECIES: hybrid histidine kinase/response regulator HrmK [unclassified Tolypothrix]|uniref:hybrid histidine kinase/response regulator HrmK n=1 Tax=unclassified Tolypothrix TaxID=2649714 RepID=UPI0005EAAB83|nr:MULTISPECIES: hybrid histidine kinase/response regulator HrmK [unclassified Tolypothrix]BAY93178.1 hybrid histidine kinase [Microchaete diplosiphon NIES-3275]EKF00446.1 sensor histidine kinase [Tolypothrix sp. PCC 7601]MBE9082938.1 response regulator [Tolypothrix sp. LEGE 11397]UYD27053.1 response regulator [Tolypothrix sp. PCC 7712]UYD37089.1 response regulator [Tolypothrix sp. PCC 7601]